MSLSVCSTPPPPVDRGTQVVIRQKAQTAMQSAGVKSYAWTISWPTQGRFYTKKKRFLPCLFCFFLVVPAVGDVVVPVGKRDGCFVICFVTVYCVVAVSIGKNGWMVGWLSHPYPLEIRRVRVASLTTHHPHRFPPPSRTQSAGPTRSWGGRQRRTP